MSRATINSPPREVMLKTRLPCAIDFSRRAIMPASMSPATWTGAACRSGAAMGGVPRRSAVSDGSIGPEPSRLRAGAPVPTADGDDGDLLFKLDPGFENALLAVHAAPGFFGGG